MRALLIPVEGPVEVIELDREGNLETLQGAVGGYIEAVPIPAFVPGYELATAYVNEEGKLDGLPFNGRATDFMVPGVGLMWGDYIAGPMVVCGFDPETGDTAELPHTVYKRVLHIAQEAGSKEVST